VVLTRSHMAGSPYGSPYRVHAWAADRSRSEHALPTRTGGTAPCLVAGRSASRSSQSERRRPSRCDRSRSRSSACWRPTRWPSGRRSGRSRSETTQSAGHLDRRRPLPTNRLDVGSFRPAGAKIPGGSKFLSRFSIVDRAYLV